MNYLGAKMLCKVLLQARRKSTKTEKETVRVEQTLDQIERVSKLTENVAGWLDAVVLP